MRRDTPRPALLALLVACPLAAAQTPRPVPDAEAQARALALVKQVLADDYTRAARDPARFAHALLDQGKAVKDDLALRYVLLREARDAATRAGSAAAALEAVEILGREYALDTSTLRIDALISAEPAATKTTDARALATAALELLDRALGCDRYDLAARLAPALESAASRADDAEFLAVARKRAAKARCLHEEHLRVERFAARLKADPSDAEAAAEVGRFRALHCGDWERGLPLLARGADTSLKVLARRDLDGPKAIRDQADLGESWRALAGSLDGRPQAVALLRAAHWYQQALLDADGDERAPLEKRLREVANQLPSGERLAGYYAPLRRVVAHQGNVTAVAFDRDGRRFFSAGADKVVRLWDAETGAERRRIEGHEDWVRCVAVSADGRRAVTCGDDSTVRLWDLPSGRLLKVLKGHGEWVRSVAFLPDGRVVSASDDQTLRLWDVSSGKEVRRFTGHTGYVWSVAVQRAAGFNPAAPVRLLSGGGDGTARLWDVDGGKELKRFEGHRGNVHGVALSPDGRRALTAGADGTVRLWEVETGKEVAQLRGHKGSAWCVSFSPDGRLALSGGSDGTARVWDLASGKETARLRGHNSLVLSAAFSADGRRVLTGGADKTVRLWQELSR